MLKDLKNAVIKVDVRIAMHNGDTTVLGPFRGETCEHLRQFWQRRYPDGVVSFSTTCETMAHTWTVYDGGQIYRESQEKNIVDDSEIRISMDYHWKCYMHSLHMARNEPKRSNRRFYLKDACRNRRIYWRLKRRQ